MILSLAAGAFTKHSVVSNLMPFSGEKGQKITSWPTQRGIKVLLRYYKVNTALEDCQAIVNRVLMFVQIFIAADETVKRRQFYKF